MKASRILRLALATITLGMMAVAPLVTLEASGQQAKPKPAGEPTQNAPTNPKLPLNGIVEVANLPCNGGGEFPTSWTKELVFVEAPQAICVRWSGKTATESANWELYKFVSNGPAEKLKSGNVPAATLANTTSIFSIEVRPPLPKFNTTTSNQKY